MENTEFDTDTILTNFLTDYVEGSLSKFERASFEDYLSENKSEKAFAKKVLKGKRALSLLAKHMNTTGLEVSDRV